MFQSPGALPEVTEAQGRGRCVLNQEIKPQKNGRGQAGRTYQFPSWCCITAVGKETVLGNVENAGLPGHGEV